ncbi:hypothetical protein GOEFS_015_00100 [Gordonia effusa NBRC 100432]|uniref:Uncharacterized protein n=1 Tax=Gordonia effusa NBRC 100432 TaxID=1077974 RepID=H0QVK7_9ACTN|nr:hypothetical protein [Gordonia effusa]GAB16813.1 hypothetical protein GOEFS_015_00100 [Gordonia effusa NBRC 100432]
MHLPDSTAATRPAVRKIVALTGAAGLLLAVALLGSIGTGAADAFPGLGGGHSHSQGGSDGGSSNNGGSSNSGGNGTGFGPANSNPNNNDPDDDDDDDDNGNNGGSSAPPKLNIPKYTPPTSDSSPTTPRSRSGDGSSSQWNGGGHPKQPWEKDQTPTAPKATGPKAAPHAPVAPPAAVAPPAVIAPPAAAGGGNGNATAPKPVTKPRVATPHAVKSPAKHTPGPAPVTPKVGAPEPTVAPPVMAAAELGDFAGGVAPAALLILGSAALLGSGRFLDAISAART